jgi:hypothetical protein
MWGSGKGDNYRAIVDGSTPGPVYGWVQNDGAAAGAAMVSWAFSAALGPVGLGGLVFATVLGGTLGSLMG